MKKVILAVMACTVLSGCTHARHTQCQDLASQADGAQIGAIMNGGYLAERQANIAQIEYNQCEQQMSTIDYATGGRASQNATQGTVAPAPMPTRRDVKFTSSTGRDVAYMSGNELVIGGMGYQFAKSLPPTAATKNETDGTKKGDLLTAEFYVNNAHTLGAAIGTNTTQGKMYVTTFPIVNGKPDMKQADANEVQVTQGKY
ncbi:hypothetical protein ACV3J7_20830 [Salmonella enterica]